MTIFDSVAEGIGKFCDKAFNKGWMLYAAIGLVVIILWLVLFSK